MESLPTTSGATAFPICAPWQLLARWDQEIDQAIAHLEAACDLARQLDLPGELWQMLAALGELYQLSTNAHQAREACAEAAQIIQSLADRMGNEQQRTTFLSAQQVRVVLEQNATTHQPGFFPA